MTAKEHVALSACKLFLAMKESGRAIVFGELPIVLC